TPTSRLALHDALPILAKASAAFDYCGISEGIGCDVCAQVCPRLGVREFDMRDSVLPRGEGVYEGLFGRYRRIVAARCKDPEILRSEEHTSELQSPDHL